MDLKWHLHELVTPQKKNVTSAGPVSKKIPAVIFSG